MGEPREPSTNEPSAFEPSTFESADQPPATPLLATASGTIAVGAPLLRAALLAPRGGASFRRRTAALAVTWSGGATATGQFDPRLWRVDRDDLRTRVVLPAATAAGAVAVFAAGAVVVAKVPFLRREIETVIAHATRGSFVQATALALVTGASEELFFRGTIHDVANALDLPVVPTSTAVYAATTCVTGNPLLVLASGLLGALAGVARERTGSLVAPTVLHLGWSIGMIAVLPRVVRREQPVSGVGTRLRRRDG